MKLKTFLIVLMFSILPFGISAWGYTVPVDLKMGKYYQYIKVTWTTDYFTLVINHEKDRINFDQLSGNSTLHFQAKPGLKIRSVIIKLKEALKPKNKIQYDHVFDENGDSIPGYSVTLSNDSVNNIITYSVPELGDVSGLAFSMSRQISISEILVDVVSTRKQTVTIKQNSANGWTTLFTDYAVDIPAGCSAYYATSYDANAHSVSLTKVDGRIAKNQGVLIAGSQGSSYDFVETFEETAQPEANYFRGRSEKVSSGYVWYYLSTDGCFKRVDGNDPERLNAGKAYLYLPDSPSSEAKSLAMFFFDTPSSIADETVAGRHDDSLAGPAVSLSGQTVSAGYRGIVIRNGKKYLNK